MGERVKPSVARVDIEQAFEIVLAQYDHPRFSLVERAEAIAAKGRALAFLAQVEAREALLRKAILACHAAAEIRTDDKEVIRTRSLAREVIGEYGEPGGMNPR